MVNQDEEFCDGSSIHEGFSWNCADWDPQYVSGKLGCDSNCEFIADDAHCVRKPTSKCGNGILEDDEWCDGTKFTDNLTCAAWSSEFSGGKLKCTKDCQIDDSGCEKIQASACGNGTIDPGEECDTNTFTNKYCKNYSSIYKSGTLKCTNDCRIDTSACVAYCGDGTVSYSRGEECDTNLADPSNPKYYTALSSCQKRLETVMLAYFPAKAIAKSMLMDVIWQLTAVTASSMVMSGVTERSSWITRVPAITGIRIMYRGI